MGKQQDRHATTQIKVLVVDDHPLIREGLAKILSLETDMVIVGYASDGEEALVQVKSLTPDVVLLDINLPGINGFQVAHQLKKRRAGVAIVVLTAYHDTQQVLMAMRVGASAYCAKNICLDTLIAIIRDVANGQYVIDGERMTRQEAQSWVHRRAAERIGPYTDDPEHGFIPLSRRETEILTAVTQGLSNKEIASVFCISQQTVKNHMTSILRKLHVEDRTQAAVMALRHGWVRIEDDETQ